MKNYEPDRVVHGDKKQNTAKGKFSVRWENLNAWEVTNFNWLQNVLAGLLWKKDLNHWNTHTHVRKNKFWPRLSLPCICSLIQHTLLEWKTSDLWQCTNLRFGAHLSTHAQTHPTGWAPSLKTFTGLAVSSIWDMHPHSSLLLTFWSLCFIYSGIWFCFPLHYNFYLSVGF